MTDLELNKFLHEKVMGECWHEGITWNENGYGTCSKCGVGEINGGWPSNPVLYLPSYTTNPADYWRLLQKVKSDEKFDYYMTRLFSEIGCRGVVDTISDMRRGCDAIAEFFGKDK